MNGTVTVVSARFYEEVANMLETGARAVLEEAGISAELYHVPGAFEIPGTIARIAADAAKQDKLISGHIALGCVIRGETSHYDHICTESVRGLMDLSVRELLTIGNGILTCETMEHALERADPARRNKGADAARACLAMIPAPLPKKL